MIVLAQAGTEVSAVCGDQPSLVCERVYEWSGSRVLAELATWFIERGLTVLLILLAGWLVSRVVKRAIEHFREKIDRPSLRDVGRDPLVSQEAEELRAKARADTLVTVFRSVALIIIWVFTGLLALGQLGINLAPLIAGAGIAGIAIAWGSKSAIEDFLSGLFMMIEDTYSVGDDIDFGKGRGTVEKVSLRSTSIRTRQGVVWTVPNGKIAHIANFSQLWARAQVDIEVSYNCLYAKLWARAQVDIEVSYNCDLRQAMEVIRQAGQEMWEDPEWGDDELSEPPQVKGVQSLGESGIFIRVRAKTRSSVQWRTERELRLRIKEALDAAGIEMPFPHRTLIVQHGEDGGIT